MFFQECRMKYWYTMSKVCQDHVCTAVLLSVLTLTMYFTFPQLVGDTETAISTLFESARQNSPCIIIFDQVCCHGCFYEYDCHFLIGLHKGIYRAFHTQLAVLRNHNHCVLYRIPLPVYSQIITFMLSASWRNHI